DCLTSPGSATRLVANKFRESVGGTLKELRLRWLQIEDRDSLEHRKVVSEWLATQTKLDKKSFKVIVWMRGRPFKTEGNPSPELVKQICELLHAVKLTPLIIGEQCPLSAEEL